MTLQANPDIAKRDNGASRTIQQALSQLPSDGTHSNTQYLSNMQYNFLFIFINHKSEYPLITLQYESYNMNPLPAKTDIAKRDKNSHGQNDVLKHTIKDQSGTIFYLRNI